MIRPPSRHFRKDRSPLSRGGRMPAVLLVLGTVAGALGGCLGQIGDPAEQGGTGGPDGTGGTGGQEPALEPAAAGLRMLTTGEYRESIRDLLGAAVEIPADLLPYQERTDGFTTIAAGEIEPEKLGLQAEKLDDASREAARQVFANKAGREQLVGCSPSDAEDPCVAAFLASFGRKAWRREMGADEVTRYRKVVTAAASELGDVWKGLEYGTAALLASPNFLYKVELGEDSPEHPSWHRYGDYEMATRLAYFIWGTTPDEELLDAAAAGELVTVEGVRAQALRLLSSPRGRAGLMRALEEHLVIDQVGSISKDPEAYPEMNAELAKAMGTEMSLLVEEVLFERGEDFRELFVTHDTFVDPQLAAFYGLEAPAADGFGLVSLPPGTGRAGLLGTAGFLASNAKLTRASAVARGVFINDRLLCRPIAAPPANVATGAIDEQQDGTPKTMRERLESHRKNPSCASCHDSIDPLGLPLEHFDGIGRYREMDQGLKIDASGELDGVEFDCATGEGKALHGSDATGPCFVSQLYRFATGHHETGSEQHELDRLSTELEEANGFRLTDVVMAIVTSDAFRYAGDPR
jgi:hypothetical protein